MHVKWDDRLTLGVDFMDQEHKDIIEKLEDVLQTLDFNAPSESDIKKFMAFEEAVTNHFAHEELMMHQYGYPKLEVHAKAHEKIVRKIVKYKEMFLTTSIDQTMLERIESDVAYIFKLHLLEEDRELEVFVHKLSQKD